MERHGAGLLIVAAGVGVAGNSDRHPLKGDCQQKTPIHRKPISLFAGLPLWVQRQPLSGPHPVFLLFVDLQPGTHQDQGRSRRENRWLRSEEIFDIS
jgi:hypothetical protein